MFPRNSSAVSEFLPNFRTDLQAHFSYYRCMNERLPVNCSGSHYWPYNKRMSSTPSEKWLGLTTPSFQPSLKSLRYCHVHSHAPLPTSMPTGPNQVFNIALLSRQWNLHKRQVCYQNSDVPSLFNQPANLTTASSISPVQDSSNVHKMHHGTLSNQESSSRDTSF